MSTAIETENLSKTFKGKTAVDHLNLSIKKNELFGLLGVNGAGKTTTIKMLCRLMHPDSGKIKVHGEELSDTEAKQIINFSPQETAVAPNLTVKENLEMMAGMYGLNKTTAAENTIKTIKELHLNEVENSRAKVLSGGWQRRLSIAMAMVTDPEILFLDEPTLGLDVIARHELWHTISELKTKRTIILTTHYLEEAENLCDRIAVMAEGRIKAMGTAEELKKKAGCDDFEKAFIALAGAEAGRTEI